MDKRKVKLSDIDMLVDNRLEFICSLKNIANIEEFT